MKLIQGERIVAMDDEDIMKLEAERNLPELRGSKMQVDWARTIRAGHIGLIINTSTRDSHGKSTKDIEFARCIAEKLVTESCMNSSASHWIDRLTKGGLLNGYRDFHVAKRAAKEAAAAQAKENTMPRYFAIRRLESPAPAFMALIFDNRRRRDDYILKNKDVRRVSADYVGRYAIERRDGRNYGRRVHADGTMTDERI